MKTLGFALFSILLLTSTVQAAAPTAPDQIVQKATNHLQDLLSKNSAKYKADTALFYNVVDDAVVPYFDTRFIAQLVLGRNWRTADEAQRKRFEAAFKSMLIRTYANALLEYYDSVRVEWKPIRLAPDATEVTVNSNLIRNGKQPIPVGFSMRNNAGQWKIYDIVVENISLIDNFRSQVNSEIKKTSLDEVITRMETGAYSRKVELRSKS